MPIKRKRCCRCYHELPVGKTTWSPRWAWWAGGVIGVESNENHRTLVYASDGPSLGAIGIIPGRVPEYRSYAIAYDPQSGIAWPDKEYIGSFRSLHDAKRAVEIRVKIAKLWP